MRQCDCGHHLLPRFRKLDALIAEGYGDVRFLGFPDHGEGDSSPVKTGNVVHLAVTGRRGTCEAIWFPVTKAA